MILLGAQALDLEALAGHRGSAFGAMSGVAQPTESQWLDRISLSLHASDPKRPIWVEEKGARIGCLAVPDLLRERMRFAEVVEVRSPLAARVARLASEYFAAQPDDLLKPLDRLRHRLPDSEFQRARAFVVHGRLEEAIRLVLPYYDNSYVPIEPSRVLRTVELESARLDSQAKELLALG